MGAICPLIGLDACCAPPTDRTVQAAISSVTLGEECPEEDSSSEDCGTAFCGCGPTSVQLELGATGADSAVPSTIEVVSVRLLHEGEVVAILPPRSLRMWGDDGYVAWDGSLYVGDELRVSVETGSPDWELLGGGDLWSTYGLVFRVELTLIVDGVARELSFEPVIREPDIAT